MRLHTGWVTGAIAALALNGAAFADVTVSHSNDPTAALGGQMAMLLGAEKQAINALPDVRLTELAVGPEVQTRTSTAKPEAPEEPEVPARCGASTVMVPTRFCHG